jgi:uncharacterized protein YggE
MRRHELAVVGVALLLAVAGCSAGPTGAADATPTASQSDSTIRVTGSGSADAAPDRAVLEVSVESTARDAATARRRLAENTSRMRAAVEDAGVAPDRITTRRYDIRQDRRRPREEGADPRLRYVAAHDFRITVDDPDRVGTVIDAAVGEGTTEIDDVTFTLSTERRRTLERQARNAAMTDARTEAGALAADADLAVTGVRVIRTTRRGAPRPADGAATRTATPAPTAAPPTDLEAGPVTVTTTVEVVYEAAPDGSTGNGTVTA